MTYMTKSILTFVVSTLLAPAAGAHGIWIAQRHGDQAVIYGHGASDEAYDPAKIVELKAYDSSLAPVGLKQKTEDDHAYVHGDARHAVITAVFDNGFWTEKTDGSWENKPKSKVKDGKTTGRYFKYATSIVAHPKAELKPFGMPLEIVSLADPTTLKAGDELTIQVLADGRPVPDAKVTAEYTTASHEPVLKTDSQGKLTIRIRNQGLNVIVASMSEKTPASADQDEIGRLATLTFTLGHGEE